MTPEDFMQLRPDTPGYINYTEAGRAAARDNKPKPFNADKTFGSVKAASGLGLRTLSSNATQSRMALPLSDVAKSGVQSIGTTAKSSQPAKTEPSDLDRLKGAYDIDYKYRGLYGNQDIDLSKRKIKEVNTLANNEANRALGMELATRLPYASFEQNLTSMRQAGVNAANMTNSISGAYNSSVSKLNPVSMSL
ncbi:MAG: hypothetical protein ACK5U6_17340 [Pseudanabaena sp.]|jgi:hypothetical protein